MPRASVQNLQLQLLESRCEDHGNYLTMLARDICKLHSRCALLMSPPAHHVHAHAHAHAHFAHGLNVALLATIVALLILIGALVFPVTRLATTQALVSTWEPFFG